MPCLNALHDKAFDKGLITIDKNYCVVNSKQLRAREMALLVKYGTVNEKQIWMLRYGFTFEDIEWLEPYIVNISQEEVIFNREINKLPLEKMDIIKRFV